MKSEPELRPLRDDEYDEWRRAITDGYAEQIETLADTPRAAARAKAETDMATTLPQGLATPGHWIFALEVGGERVGQLWLAERTMDGRRVMYVYNVEVDELHRGAGLGRAAMLLAEAQALARGIDRIELNVFGGNAVALGLYRSLGYVERAISMAKDLSDPATAQIADTKKPNRTVPYQTDPRVDAYIDALPEWQQKICRHVRDLVHAADPDVVETIKRTRQPYFVLDGNICALLATKDHVNVFLYDGGIVPDPEGIITAGHDNKTARTAAFWQGDPINDAALTRMFRQIIANNRAGGWRRIKRSDPR